MKVTNPGGQGYPITEVFAWVVEHGPGDESIPAVRISDRWLPCVTTSEELARSHMQRAVTTLVDETSTKAKLVRFDLADTLEEIAP